MTCYASNNRSLMLTHFDTCQKHIKKILKIFSENFSLGWELHLYSTVRRFSLLTFHEFPPKPLDFLYKTTGLAADFVIFGKFWFLRKQNARSTQSKFFREFFLMWFLCVSDIYRSVWALMTDYSMRNMLLKIVLFSRKTWKPNGK